MLPGNLTYNLERAHKGDSWQAGFGCCETQGVEGEKRGEDISPLS